jgi:hypothetical protein
MLIYVNQFELIGSDSADIAFRTVAGWLKNVTKRHFTVEQLKSGDDFTIDRAKVRTYVAIDYSPFLYSILFSHPDRTVKGRQWITEIGIKVEDDKTIVSILLETSDISTLVKEVPSTTKPRLVNFLQSNATLNSETVGLKVMNFKNHQDDFKAFSYEIHRENRNYPLVLVTNVKGTNQPLVNPEKLQEQLLGLAQVVYSKDEINSWEFEEALSRQYATWDGAVNIIYPSYGRDYCNNKLLINSVIKELMSSGTHVLQSILSFITHTTNGFNKKRHFSPTDVRAKRQKDLRTKLKARFNDLSDNNEYQQLAEDAFSQLEEQENVIEQLKERHQSDMEEQLISCIEIQDQLDKINIEINVLQMRFDELQKNTSKKGDAILVYGEEPEFYSGEFTDIAFDAIRSHLEDAAQNSRRQHVLTDILKYNEVDGTRASYLQLCKSLFNNYDGMTPKIRSELKTMNLEVIEIGTHNHIKFIGDDRYQVACAKTPSDKRVGSNIVRDIKAALL